jgi:hypothetical protein
MSHVARSSWLGFAVGILCTLAVVAGLGSVTGVWADALGQNPLPPGQEAVSPASPDSAVGRSIPIQGRLTDAGGNPISGSKSITFSLYAASTGGTAVCQDSGLVTVANGLFDMAMQHCTAADINGQGLWLGIQVAGEATEMAPRQPIYPAPYAFSLVPGAEIGGTGAGAGSLFLRDAAGVTVMGLTAAGALLDVGGSGNPGDIYVRNTTDDASFVVYGSTGDVTQALAADGLVKAAVYATCTNTYAPAGNLLRSFNHVAGTITLFDGASPGQCTIDFGFDVSARFVVATPADVMAARSVTYSAGSTANRLNFYRWNSDGIAAPGNIMVLIY